MSYDAENRLSMVDAPNPPYCIGNGEEQICYPTGGNVYRYVYDGNGRRVRRVQETANTSNETWQVYGFDGELLAEYPQSGVSVVAQPSKEYGYRNGQLLVTAEPWANLALNKTATQSSTLVAGTTIASKAVDGNAEGSMLNGHSSATNSAQNAWWQTDMESVQNIDSITVWGRTDCCPEMTTDFYLFVSDVPFASNDLNTTLNQSGVFNHYYSSYAGPASVPVNRTGRYVRVQLAGTQSLVLGEVQVWGQAAKVNWLVTDHLGTVRMIVDKAGGAGVSRHDYLPFGEELGLVGGRTNPQGYDLGDTLRQRFTQKERDTETGLDYFLARYYSSTQGRFISPDEFRGGPDELYILGSGDNEKQALPYAEITNPQSINKFQYANNNPLRFVDPDGHTPCCMTDEDVKNLNEGATNLGTAIVKEAANAFIGMGNVTRYFQGQEPVELYKPANKTQAVVMAVTGDVALFAGALGGKPQVGGVLVAETKTTSQLAAMTVANEAQTLSGAARPGAAGALVSETGQTVTATSRSGSINPGVQAVLDRVPASQRSAYHGKCCEPRLVSQAQDAGINLSRCPAYCCEGTSPRKSCSWHDNGILFELSSSTEVRRHRLMSG